MAWRGFGFLSALLVLALVHALMAARFWFVCDDAFIAFTYSANLAAGDGLTWFAGDPPVEGYSCPLWVVYLAACQSLELHPRFVAPITSAVCALALWAWVGMSVRQVGGVAAGIAAMAFLALHMALLLIDPAVQFTVAQLLVPGMAPWETLAVGLGTIAFWLMVPVSVVGRLRSRLGRAGNRWFRRAHLMAYAAWPLATMHYVLAGTDALADWSLALLFAGTGVVVTALLARGFVPAPTPVQPEASTARPALTRA